jgi:hypothetical protein
MAETSSARHKLPFLVTGQAQKELTHNEALARLDALMHPVVEAVLVLPISGLGPSDSGKCWLIGDNGQNEWAGHSGEIACWTGGSWRFLMPIDGMVVWNRAQNAQLHHIGGDWIATPILADVTGGNTIDLEARTAINLLLLHFRVIGLTSV